VDINYVSKQLTFMKTEERATLTPYRLGVVITILTALQKRASIFYFSFSINENKIHEKEIPMIKQCAPKFACRARFSLFSYRTTRMHCTPSITCRYKTTLTEVFPCFSLSCRLNAKVYYDLNLMAQACARRRELSGNGRVEWVTQLLKRDAQVITWPE
jgi:hypothetical protein